MKRTHKSSISYTFNQQQLTESRCGGRRIGEKLSIAFAAKEAQFALL